MIADLKSTINFCLQKVITKKSLKIKNFDRFVPLIIIEIVRKMSKFGPPHSNTFYVFLCC